MDVSVNLGRDNRTCGVSIPGRQGRDVVIRNIPYTTQYPWRGEESRVVRVEHANLQQDAGGVRCAAFLRTRTEDRTSIQRQEGRILI